VQHAPSNQTLLLAQARLLLARARALGPAGLRALLPAPPPAPYPQHMGLPVFVGAGCGPVTPIPDSADLTVAAALAQRIVRSHPRWTAPWLLLTRVFLIQGKFELVGRPQVPGKVSRLGWIWGVQALLALNATPMPDNADNSVPMTLPSVCCRRGWVALHCDLDKALR